MKEIAEETCAKFWRRGVDAMCHVMTKEEFDAKKRALSYFDLDAEIARARAEAEKEI